MLCMIDVRVSPIEKHRVAKGEDEQMKDGEHLLGTMARFMNSVPE